MDTVGLVSSALADALQCKPLWVKEVSGEVSYRIERFICRGFNATAPPLEQAVLICHFGGKKVSAIDTREQVTSFPSVATFLPAGVVSHWTMQSSLDFVAIYLRNDALQRVNRSSEHIIEPVALSSPLCCSLSKELVDLLVEPLEQTNTAQTYHVQALSNALVWQLCYELNKPAQKQALQSVNSRFNYVQDAMSYILGNLNEPLRSVDVAAQVGLHPSHFRRVFLQATGMSLHRYIIEQRLEMARERLTNTSLSLSEIADEVGFSSQSHMTSCFRKHFDVTPTAFRRLQLV